MGKYSEIEIKWTIPFVKHMNQPVMNAAQKMRLKMTTTKNTVQYNTIHYNTEILKKDREHKEISREKQKPKNLESTVLMRSLKRQWKLMLSSC